MPDGDIARSRVGGLPISVNDSTSEADTDTDWPEPDTGKPRDSPPNSDPLINLSRFEPGAAPLAPNVSDFTASLRKSKTFEALYDLLSTLALLGNFI